MSETPGFHYRKYNLNCKKKNIHLNNKRDAGLSKQIVISNNNFPGNRNRAWRSPVVALQIKILALRIYTADSIRLFISFSSRAVCLGVLSGGVVWWWLVYNYKVRAIRKLAQYRPSIKIQLTVRQLSFLQPQSMNCECGGIRFISVLH